MSATVSNTTGLVNSNYGYLPKSMVQNGTATVSEATAKAVQEGIQARLDELPDVGDEAFMRLVANLTPQDVSTQENLKANLDLFAGAAALATQVDSDVMVFVGDISRLLAKLMIEQINDQRQNALNDRLAAREQAKANLMNQADKMDDAAEKMIAGAQTALITGLVAAGVQFLGSIASIAGAAKALKNMGAEVKNTQLAAKNAESAFDQFENATDEAQKTLASMKFQLSNTQVGAASKVIDKANQWAQLFSGIGQLANSVGEGARSYGNSADATKQAEAKKDEAEGSREAANAQEAQQMADNKKQIEDSLNDMLKQIINFLKELKEAEVDAMRSLTKV